MDNTLTLSDVQIAAEKNNFDFLNFIPLCFISPQVDLLYKIAIKFESADFLKKLHELGYNISFNMIIELDSPLAYEICHSGMRDESVSIRDEMCCNKMFYAAYKGASELALYLANDDEIDDGDELLGVPSAKTLKKDGFKFSDLRQTGYRNIFDIAIKTNNDELARVLFKKNATLRSKVDKYWLKKLKNQFAL